MRELLQLACVAGLALCGVLSLLPFRFRRKWKSWNLYLPVAGITLYAVYEASLPAEVDVGGAMHFIVPLLLFLLLNSMAKVVVLRVLLDRAGGSRRQLRHQPQRQVQLAAGLLIAAGCALWFWVTKA